MREKAKGMGDTLPPVKPVAPRAQKYMKKWAKWRGDTAIVPGPKEAKAKANGLLGLVEEQCYVAKFYLRQPHGKAKAMRTLERVSRVCAEYTGAVTPPVALALVKLRLNVAAVSSRCGKHDMALHEAQVALREADGVAQALDMVGHGGYGAADTAVLACLAQQAIAAELAHLGAPEMSITDMLQNAKYTASTFLPPTHPVGKLAARAHKEREYSAKVAMGEAEAPLAPLQQMLRQTLEAQRAQALQGSPEAPSVPGVYPGDDFSGKVMVDAKSGELLAATSLPLFELEEQQGRTRPEGRRGREFAPDDGLQLPAIEAAEDGPDFPSPPEWIDPASSPTLRGPFALSPSDEMRAELEDLASKIEDAALDLEYKQNQSLPALPKAPSLPLLGQYKPM